MRTKRHTQRKQHLLLQLSSVSHSLVQGKAEHFIESDATNRFVKNCDAVPIPAINV